VESANDRKGGGGSVLRKLSRNEEPLIFAETL
jgi:hypothetical protein